MPKSPEQFGVSKEKSKEELETELSKVWEYWEQRNRAIEGMASVLDSVRPVAEEIERDPNKKDLILLATLRIIELQAMLETKKSWPISEEFKNDKEDLMENEAREQLEQEKAKLNSLLAEFKEGSSK